MTEEQNDQPAEGPVSASNPETAPTGVPETTEPGGHSAAGRLAPAAEQPLPEQPDTPPAGVAQDPTPTAGSTPPQGTYAMGALAGNPMLGTGPASSFGGSAHRPRRPHLVGAPGRRGPRPLQATTASATACWPAQLQSRSSAPGSASATPRRTTGAAPRPSTRRRAARRRPPVPVPGHPAAPAPRGTPSATVRPSVAPSEARAAPAAPGARAPAARDRRTRRARVTPTPSPRRSTRAWSTSTPRSATSRSRLPARASCCRATASS